jgi:hypothetical protein
MSIEDMKAEADAEEVEAEKVEAEERTAETLKTADSYGEKLLPVILIIGNAACAMFRRQPLSVNQAVAVTKAATDVMAEYELPQLPPKVEAWAGLALCVGTIALTQPKLPDDIEAEPGQAEEESDATRPEPAAAEKAGGAQFADTNLNIGGQGYAEP